MALVQILITAFIFALLRASTAWCYPTTTFVQEQNHELQARSTHVKWSKLSLEAILAISGSLLSLAILAGFAIWKFCGRKKS